MKKITIKTIYKIAAIIIFIVLLFFTYLIAELNDAPGFIIFGTAINIGCSLFIFGMGSLIESIRHNNKLLEDIYSEIKKEN